MQNPADYWGLWKSAFIKPLEVPQVRDAVSKILSHIDIYQHVSSLTSVPWYVVACLHQREASLNFTTWLANGDPLFDKAGDPLLTSHVPSGLGPAHSWVDGAVISLKNHHAICHNKAWDICNTLIVLEKYNGLGYFNRELNSPYLWSFTNHYSQGKFARDGVFDPHLVDLEPGCASLLIGLKGFGVNLNEVSPT